MTQVNFFRLYFLTLHVCFYTTFQTVERTGDSTNEIKDVSYMFWRSFNLTFKAIVFDEIRMQPQKNLFFGFLFRDSQENLVTPFHFFVVLSAHNSLPLQGFRFQLQQSAFCGTFSRFPQAAKMVLASIKGQKWFFNNQKSVFLNNNKTDSP